MKKSEISKATTSGRSDYWDAIRGFSVLWLVVIHTSYLVNWNPFGADFYIYWFPTMEPIIFISGFLICQRTYQVLASGELSVLEVMKRYSFRRILRIVPVYYFFVFFYFLFPGLLELPLQKSLWEFLSFTMNNNLDLSGSSHLWTVCLEMGCYLVLLLLIPLLLKKSIHVILWGLVLASLLGRIYMTQEYGVMSYDDYFKRLWYPTFFHWDAFWIGCSVGLFYSKGLKFSLRQQQLFFSLAVVMVFLYAVGTYFSEEKMMILRQLFTPLWGAGISIFLFLGIEAVPIRWIHAFSLQKIGQMSFTMYLVHKVAIHNFTQINRSLEILPARTWLELGFCYAFVFACTFVAFHLIERPLGVYVQRYLKASEARKSLAG